MIRRRASRRRSLMRCAPVVIALCTCPAAFPQLFAWEADAWPQDSGFSIDQIFCGPQLWLNDGWFHQHVDLCPGYDPPGGQTATYRRSLADFNGAPDFYVERRIESDAPRGELVPWGGGAGLAVSGSGGVHYIFGIVSDQAWLHRDNLLPSTFVDFAAGVAHTHRLELYGTAQYIWSVDGQTVDVGIPEGQFPSSFPDIIWRTRAAWGPSTTRWDYIRYGRIPQLTPGDVNCDDAINFLDIDPFLLALFDTDAYGQAHPGCLITSADLDGDDLVNFFDIDPFVECLFGTCP